MSYTFPENTRWISRYGKIISSLKIHYCDVIRCSYGLTSHGAYGYSILMDNGDTYSINTPRISEFEAGFPEFPYEIRDYLTKVQTREENMLKRIDMLEKTMMKLLPLIEKFLSDAEKRLDEQNKN